MDPIISISCVTYNHEKYIAQCLDGFLMQKTTYTYEILVHDDASTDGTADIIRTYADRYPDIIKPILQTENQYSKGIRVSAVFNWSRAQGKYIALCEGDDYWTDPNKLQKQVDFLEGHAEFVGTAHNFQPVDEDGRSIRYFKQFPAHVYDKKDAENLKWLGQVGTFVFRNIFRDMEPAVWNGYLNCKAIGDRKLSLLLGCTGPVYYFAEQMSCYRHVTTHGDSWSARTANVNTSYMKLESYKELIRFAEEQLHVHINPEPHIRKVVVDAFAFTLRHPSEKNRHIFKQLYTTERFRKFLCIWDILVDMVQRIFKKIRIK